MKIGNTPFEKIQTKKFGKNSVFAKLESFNFSGSIKARMADFMIKRALQSGQLRKNFTIIEATTGNTGIAFSALAHKFKLKMVAVMPENLSVERIQLMKYYNAKVVLTPAKSGPSGAIKVRDKIAKKIKNSWIPDQFNNIENVYSHEYGIGQELVKEMKMFNIIPNFFVHGVGTGGTLIGVGNVLKRHFPNIQIVAVEPKELPVLSMIKENYQKKEKKQDFHGIQGIGEGFVPGIVKISKIDKVVTVSTKEAIQNMMMLGKNEGFSVGISSGANIAAIRKLISKKELKNAIFITVFADGIDRYLSEIKKL